MTRQEALKLRAIVELATTSLDDKTASEGALLFPRLKQNGELVRANTRINWNGTIKKATVDIWDNAENNPDNAPTLWADIEYKNGYRYIPNVITVSTSFAIGECGWWNGKLYKSLINANVYTPEQYTSGWELVKEEDIVNV